MTIAICARRIELTSAQAAAGEVEARLVYNRGGFGLVDYVENFPPADAFWYLPLNNIANSVPEHCGADRRQYRHAVSDSSLARENERVYFHFA